MRDKNKILVYNKYISILSHSFREQARKGAKEIRNRRTTKLMKKKKELWQRGLEVQARHNIS